jgi:hypothetical protein
MVKPLLITGFAPDLDRPEVLVRQVRALKEQIEDEPGTVVLLAQSSYGSLIRRREEGRRIAAPAPSSPLRELTNVLAPFAVYFGHDADLAAETPREGRASRDAEYEAAFQGKRALPDDGWRWWRLRKRDAYERRRRRLYEVLYHEGRPTRQLQRLALRLIDDLRGSSRGEESDDVFDDAWTTERIIGQMGLAAGPYYEAIWASCDADERIVLAQLARDGIANPKAYPTILDLVHKGLVHRDPALRLMNRSFGEFVRRALPRWQLVELEEEEGTSAWSILKWLLPLPLLLIGGFLFLTQQDAVSNVIGLAIAIASLVPTFINFYQQFQQASAAGARGSAD